MILRNPGNTLKIRERSNVALGTANYFGIAWVHDATLGIGNPVDRMTMYLNDDSPAPVTLINNDETSGATNITPLLMGAKRGITVGDMQHLDADVVDYFLFDHASNQQEITDAFCYWKGRYPSISLSSVVCPSAGTVFNRSFNQPFNRPFN